MPPALLFVFCFLDSVANFAWAGFKLTIH
jgi:hypothetical protein